MQTELDLKQAYAAARPASQAAFQRAQRVLAGGAGHDLRFARPMPLYIARAKGSRKWDLDGHEYIDFLMGNGALLLGHAAPEVVAAIQEALAHGTHFGNDHLPQIEWAEQIRRLMPSAERIRFVNSGTEATHLALRVARACTGRTRILRFAGHFHGWHDGVVHGFQPPFEADGSTGVPAGVRTESILIADGDLNRVEHALATDDDIAGILIEPSGGSWGRQPLDPQFLHGLREITARRNRLLIFDEVITGFRYSPGGAQELYGVRPDLTCLAKIVAGGMPGGALAGRADLMAAFELTGVTHHDRFERVAHQGTFNAAPLSVAAGLATLRRIASGEPTRQADSAAAHLRERWEEVLERHGVAGYVYGVSSTFHVYFETDPRRLDAASTRSDLYTVDPARLKGMPGELVATYQRALRSFGADNMSCTGGVLSAAHTAEDIDRSTEIFEATVLHLRDAGVVKPMPD
ncbi:MAG: aminotransferase class III-fold pyridoxal phosphate-dependent enzyme [Planctomycetes bacterium]|nr:aminotransferase class III-fold pyridoxal phosphate-dependent enzyme [Planctomycetota bacterium]